MKKTSKNMTMGMALGMCLGATLGNLIGNLFDGNMVMGTSIGLSIGLLVGLVIGLEKDKVVNKQLEEKGYTIKSIEKNEETLEYKITIVSNEQKEEIVIVSSGTMETELFSIGDMVFIDEDGQIEQAFDKDDED